MGPVDMSNRAHLWVRLAAVGVIATAASIPRGGAFEDAVAREPLAMSSARVVAAANVSRSPESADAEPVRVPVSAEAPSPLGRRAARPSQVPHHVAEAIARDVTSSTGARAALTAAVLEDAEAAPGEVARF